MMVGDQTNIRCQLIWGEVVFFGQQVDRAQHRAIGLKNWHVDTRPKTQRGDQRMVKEIARKLWRGVCDKDLTSGDAMIIPAIPRDGFGA